MRFAMVEMKLFIAKILSKYKFNKCDQTSVNVLYVVLNFLLNYLFLFNSKKDEMILLKAPMAQSKNPIILKIEKRF
jgi:hypothetical protein